MDLHIRPDPVHRLIYWTLYYWAVVLGGFALLPPLALVVIAVNGEFAGPVGPAGRVLTALAWAVCAIPFVRLAHRVNRSFLDRTTLRLTPTSLHIGRLGQTEVDFDAIRDVYFAVGYGFPRRRYASAGRDRFGLMLLVLVDGAAVPLELRPGDAKRPAQERARDPFAQALIRALGPKLRDHQPLPALARPLRVNRRQYLRASDAGLPA